MDKLKRSFIGKFIAVMLLIISLPAGILLAVFIGIVVQEGKFLPGEIDDAIDERVDYISSQYEVDALVYYLATIEGNKGLIEKFRNNFSEEHSNYSFQIEATAGFDSEMESLINFSCDSYIRSYSKYYYIIYSPNQFYWYYCHDGEGVCSHYGVFEYPDNLLGYGYEVDVENNDSSQIVVNDGKDKIDIYGIMNYGEPVFGYCYDEKYVSEYVIPDNAEIVSEIHMTAMVKENLTARDNYYRSKLVKYGKLTYRLMIPCFIIFCIIFFLCNVYLIAACGWVKGKDEIYLNKFNRIPYDIILGVILVEFFLVYREYDYYSNIYYIGWLIGLLGIVYPVVLCTTVTRIKTGTLLSNTIIVRSFRWVKKICGIIWHNLPFVGKYLGIIAGVSILEYFIVVYADSGGMLVVYLVTVNLVAAVWLALTLLKLKKLKEAAAEIAGGNVEYRIETGELRGDIKAHADNLNCISDGIREAVSEQMKSERMKMELITNVSHDIKTPLTSIINYVDLMSKEEINNPKVKEYLEVLERQSARLKKLIQDLIDASKASSGTMPVELANADVRVLLEQVLGEFSEKLEDRGINVMTKYLSENLEVTADGRLLWRVFENLINNVVKYALENTRMYIDVADSGKFIEITIKNISSIELNISGDELMERFVRGDESRNTEGSGLGLSIAKSLMELQGGTMEIKVDGDLFKVILSLVKNNSTEN
ncbi:MAG: sensor histidine kinase [Wujia sp.]